jgi:hypothetical protein
MERRARKLAMLDQRFRARRMAGQVTVDTEWTPVPLTHAAILPTRAILGKAHTGGSAAFDVPCYQDRFQLLPRGCHDVRE